MNLGLLYADLGDVDNAIPHLKTAEDRGIAQAAYVIGRLFEGRDDLWGAEAAYRRADAAGDKDAAYGLASVLMKHDDVQSARDAFVRARDRGHEGAGSRSRWLWRRQRGVVVALTAVAERGGPH
jgi:tetratricopeptide (TPR) repeat protein